MPFTDPLIFVLIVLGVVLACLIIVYSMRERGKKENKVSHEEKIRMESKSLPSGLKEVFLEMTQCALGMSLEF